MAKSRINLSNMVSSDEEIFIANNIMDKAAEVRDILTQIVTTYNYIEREYKKVWNDPKTRGSFKTITEKMAAVCKKRASYAHNQQVTMYRSIEKSVQKNKAASNSLRADVEGAAEAMMNEINADARDQLIR